MENFTDPQLWYAAAKYTAIAAAGFGLICAIIFIAGLATGHAVYIGR